MATTLIDSITTIDAHYLYEGRAAAYLVVDGDEAAFVDTGTRFSVPYLLAALKVKGLAPEQVRYILVTHIHLDHSGGVAELAKHCPAAAVIAHPRAERHIVDPAKLVASARTVYGPKFDALYGGIEPVAKARVRAVEDGEILDLGKRTFTLPHTPGHAPHHYAVVDSACNAVLSGDAFGLSYRQLQGGTKPFLSYVCAPPAFDPQVAKASMDRILATGADRVFVTHYGAFTALQEGAELVAGSLEAYDALATEAAGTDLEGEALVDYCHGKTLAIIKDEMRACGLDPDQEDLLFWATSELPISAQGIAVLAGRRRGEG